jgi:pilus assembly protein CpaB
MNRSIRTFIVVAIAVGIAGAATYLVYKTIQSRPAQVVEVATSYAVVAARPLPLGTRLTAPDLKLVAWPAANPLPGGFTKIEDAVDRGLIAAVAENEPLTGNNVASAEAGAGLPPTIPPGMRAISVRVNEVIGVAGFVVPGTRVDVMAILTQNNQRLARVVVGNVQVLAAGTRYDQEAAREGKAVPSSVVTLMVTPDDAEKIGLASTEGTIMLTLRNPMDTALASSTGTGAASLAGDAPAPRPAAPASSAPRRTAPVVAAAPPPPPPAPTPAPPKPVVVIRGGVVKEIIK